MIWCCWFQDVTAMKYHCFWKNHKHQLQDTYNQWFDSPASATCLLSLWDQFLVSLCLFSLSFLVLLFLLLRQALLFLLFGLLLFLIPWLLSFLLLLLHSHERKTETLGSHVFYQFDYHWWRIIPKTFQKTGEHHTTNACLVTTAGWWRRRLVGIAGVVPLFLLLLLVLLGVTGLIVRISIHTFEDLLQDPIFAFLDALGVPDQEECQGLWREEEDLLWSLLIDKQSIYIKITYIRSDICSVSTIFSHGFANAFQLSPLLCGWFIFFNLFYSAKGVWTLFAIRAMIPGVFWVLVNWIKIETTVWLKRDSNSDWKTVVTSNNCGI